MLADGTLLNKFVPKRFSIVESSSYNMYCMFKSSFLLGCLCLLDAANLFEPAGFGRTKRRFVTFSITIDQALFS